MKTQLSFLVSSLGIASSLSAAIVTNTFVANSPQNLTQQGGVTASQSTDGAGSTADRAIDGDTNGQWLGNSVTHTDPNDLAPYWQVDLGSSQSINDIVLYNRTDCCAGRLSNFTVLAGNDATFGSSLYSSGNIATQPATPFTLSGIGVTAQYVRVRLDGLGDTNEQILSLAEVEILGTASGSSFANLALGSTANQSSTLGNVASPTADKAIDGSLAGVFADGSTTHTDPAASGAVFWETTFNSLTDINEIAIYNRGDCCPTRLSNFRVSIFNGVTEVWGENYFETANGGNAGAIFSIQEDTGGFIGTGDRVRIELIGGVNNASVADGGPNVLSLREVEIYGVAVPEPSSTALLGLGGLALIFRRKK
ncbi:MAG: discoidin domain-containing protein [Akkermansiaceae bacterium]